MAKRRLIGTITSVNMHETVAVTVDRMKVHRLYGKRFRRRTVYAAHNPQNQFGLGETVLIEEHRPISKRKAWLIRERIAAPALPALIEPDDVTASGSATQVEHQPTGEQ